MVSYYITDVGRVRTNNQDSVNIVENLEGQILMIVADGMGGHNGGEIASSMAVNYLSEEWSRLVGLGSKEEIYEWIDDQIYAVNELLYNYAQEHLDSRGMGTTLVIAVITDQELVLANVGDSRGYVIKKNHLIQVTTDHTLVSALLASGEITKEEALNHPKRHVLMKAIGTNPTIEADIIDIIDDGIMGIILCSDGLTNMVLDEEIQTILNSNIAIDEKVITLVEIANAKGGSDNITIAYLDMSGDK